MPVIALLLSILFAAADQFMKMFVLKDIKPIGSKTIIKGVLSFDYTVNTGAAFSILEGGRWLFVAITAIICALLIFAMFRYTKHEFFSWAACVLIVGGGLGNMVDRLVRGYVIDYIHLSFFPAIFNFGDCCVTIGAIFFIIHILFFTETDHTEKVLRSR